MLFSFNKCHCWLWVNGDSAILLSSTTSENTSQFVFLLQKKNRAIFAYYLNPGTTGLKWKEKLSELLKIVLV